MPSTPRWGGVKELILTTLVDSDFNIDQWWADVVDIYRAELADLAARGTVAVWAALPNGLKVRPVDGAMWRAIENAATFCASGSHFVLAIDFTAGCFTPFEFVGVITGLAPFGYGAGPSSRCTGAGE
jgi:hypothetical protein